MLARLPLKGGGKVLAELASPSMGEAGAKRREGVTCRLRNYLQDMVSKLRLKF
jgi:hypothetical protein